MITRRIHWLGVLLSLALLTSCADEFLTGASITRMRLLGAQVIIDDAPERAWLRPGDNGRVSFALAFPGPAASDPPRANPVSSVRSMFLSCTEGDIGTGQPQCAEVLFLFEAYRRYQAGEFNVDAGLPDGGAPPPPPISAEDIEATFGALERGVGCDDRGDIGDPTDPNDDVPDYFGNASRGIRQVALTPQAPELRCVDRVPGVPLELAPNYVGPKRLIQGVICEYGEPVFQIAPPFFACRYEVDSDPNLPSRAPIAEVFFVSVGVEEDGATNNHPQFGATPLTIANHSATLRDTDFRPWPSVTLPADDCAGVSAGGEISVVEFGRKSVVRIELEAMRELVNAESGGRETYQVEAYSTFGELDRQFSIIDDLDLEPIVDVEWAHGERPRVGGRQIGGKRVDFYFVIRDGRGGFAIENRSVCVCAGTCPSPTP